MSTSAVETLNSISIYKIQVKGQLGFFKAGWKLAKRQYGLLMGFLLLNFLVSAVLTFFDKPGQFASMFFSVVWWAGYLNVGQKLLQKQEVKFSDFFYALKETALLKRLATPIVLGMLTLSYVVWLEPFFTFLDDRYPLLPGFVQPLIVFLTIGVQLVALVFIALAVPLMVHKKLSFKQTLAINYRLSIINVWPLTVYSLWIVLLGLASFTLVVVPFLFIFMPVSVMQYELVYRALFEGKSVEELEELC